MTLAQQLDRDWILRHIPHQDSMCLLDNVVQWDEAHIVCHASSHQAADNPLRLEGQLSVLHGIEYAAQAMAIHGALLAQGAARSKPAQGYLTSVRDVRWAPHTLHALHTLPAPLHVRADRLSGSDATVLYHFSVLCAAQEILAGRATVVLDATSLRSPSA